ncbi:MAG: hypothetical protein KF773_17700 [Deltaproteobacteria bacterium]|nr:hypothetical protein [Deltaproteobacteria bacterium]MCW5805429.1 hypothetical protein [Deltaproteobacteria bacterium]
MRWSNIAVLENCFYFLGPLAGRDGHLGTQATLDGTGPVVRLTFGDTDAFAGVHEDDGRVRLVRRSTHEFRSTWTVTETIDVTLTGDGAPRGTYRYEECESGGACPGRCTITADLVTRWHTAR